MRKFFRKIICVAAAAVMSAGLFTAAACSDVYEGKPLGGDYTTGEVVSNGGFAVEKGTYIYFINGKQSNTADNTYGEVVQGAIMRIAKTDLSARNYQNVETVVPEIVHSGNNNGGIFVYGDYIYYSTPSSNKNSDGEIQNSEIVFKRAKLDGSEVMKGGYATYKDNSIEYRYVPGEDGVVYLLYVAKDENLYGTSCINLHSVNTQTGEDKLLAYNVKSVMFDKKDVTNQRVYYTMNVTDFKYNNALSAYNQVYTVTADVKEPAKEYDFSDIKDYDAEKDPLYINYGKLVLDGVGMKDNALNLTQFNAPELFGDNAEKIERNPYTYTLSSYENGTLFYTRVSTNDKTAKLFAVKEETLLTHRPAVDNPEDYILVDGSNAANYTYIFDNKTLTGAFIASDNGLIKTVIDGNGRLITDVDNNNSYYITTGGKPTILFTNEHDGDNTNEHDGDNYVYYSVSGVGASGYSVYRICYDGGYAEYSAMPDGDSVTKYTPVRILDLDCSSDWYMPEMFDGQIIFSSLTKNMTEYKSDTTAYSHIMVCDIRSGNGVLGNAEIDELNDLYESVSKKIDEVDETVYENLKKAYRYAFYTGDSEYIDTIIKAYVDIAGEDEEKFYSKATVEKFKSFVSADGDWSEYKDKKVTVNGTEVYSNRNEYYYSLLGKMTADDKKAYDQYIKDTYLQVWPEEEPGWFESLSKGAKAGFIIGIVGGVLLIAGAVTVVTVIVVRKRKAKLPVYKKTRVKVDTTDDKSVDVYSADTEETPDGE